MFEANPFSPGKRLTEPELFSGRREQLRSATQILVQAANHNVRHALITGERGIGKSSFSSQVQGIARGEEKYLELVGATERDFHYRFLVAEHIAQDGHGVPELTSGLLKQLEAAKGLSRFAKFKFDFTIDIGPFQAAARQADTDAQDLVVKFANVVEDVTRRVEDKVDGLILVIDEIDRIAAVPGVSTFLKVATEILTSRGLENVTFMPVGLVGALEALRGDHASVARIFRLIEVPLMFPNECKEVIDKALTSTSLSIADDAAAAVTELAGGYPNNVHLLGEQAFELATTTSLSQIDLATVRAATRRVVEGAAKEDYDPRYLAIKGRSRSIVNYIATRDENDIPSSEICQHLRVRPTDVSANFDSLLRNDVIVRPQPGVYRLREPLFREYLRYIAETGYEPVQRRPQRRAR